MWAPIAIRRILALSKPANIKPVDVSQIFAEAYPTTSSQFNLISVRYKTKSRKKPKANKSDGDESDESDDEADSVGENPMLMNDPLSDASDGSKHMVLDVNSTRLDVISKNAFSITRQRADEALLKGEIYINGEKPYKKSIDVRVGDEIDFIKGMNSEDPTMVNIKRAHILEFPDKLDSHGRLKIKVSLIPDLTIKSPKLD